MIRVNLLKNKAELTRAPSEASGDPIKIDQVLSGVTINNNSQVFLLLKLVIICGGVAGLFVYERVKKAEVNKQINSFVLEVGRLENIKIEKEERAQQFPTFEKKFEKLSSHVKEIDEVASFRLGEMYVLDNLQDVITSEVWLKSLEYRQDQVLLKGASFSKPGFEDFRDRLDEHRLFSRVTVVRTGSDSQDSTIFDFELTMNLDLGAVTDGG